MARSLKVQLTGNDDQNFALVTSHLKNSTGLSRLAAQDAAKKYHKNKLTKEETS